MGGSCPERNSCEEEDRPSEAELCGDGVNDVEDPNRPRRSAICSRSEARSGDGLRSFRITSNP